VDEEDEDSVDKIDSRFKKNKNVLVYICLPSGQEEIMIDYEMCFADRQAYNNWKESSDVFMNQDGTLPQFESNMGFRSKSHNDNSNSGEWHAKTNINVSDSDYEFKLCTLIDYIKKQGYPIENSFVSYYSADF